AIRQLRPGIDTEIKSLWIERRRFEQLLRKIVSRHTAVCGDAKIRSKQCAKRDRDRNPIPNLGIAESKFEKKQNSSEPDEDRNQRKRIGTARPENQRGGSG